MSYIGKTPTAVPLSSSDLEDGIITTAKIADDAATADKIANAVNSAITANTSKTTNATHSGEVTGSGALTIADNIVDEANLKVSNSPTNGYFLAAQSGNTGGLTWQEAGGGGKILQVLQTVKTDSFSTTSTSFTDATGMTRAITPSASNSKIMIFVSLTVSATGGSNVARRFLLLRGSTAIALPSSQGSQYGSFLTQPYASNDNYNINFHFLDSPSTTSAVTYKLQMAMSNGGSSIQIGDRSADGNQQTPSIITAMEIGA